MGVEDTVTVILAGHGSWVNAHTGAPVLAARARLARSWPNTRVAFWKQEPWLTGAIRTAPTRHVVVVPWVISEGYFGARVIPREMGLPTGDALFGRVHEVHGRRVVYARAVGTHPSMSGAVARAIAARRAGRGGPFTLAVLGHGTPRHARSSASIEALAAALRDQGVADEVLTAYLDDDPRIDALLERAAHDEVLALPYFMSEGGHTMDDIPEALGLPRVDRREPVRVAGRDVWYLPAVGELDELDAVTLDRIDESLRLLEPPRRASLVTPVRHVDAEELAYGELLVTRTRRGWEVRHAMDDAPPTRRERGVEGAWSIATRGWRSKLGLGCGWVLCLGVDELADALDVFYPGGLAHGAPVPWEETAARQTGIYADLASATTEALSAAERAACAQCARSPLWRGARGGEGAPVCLEACPVFMEGVRAEGE